MMRAVIARARVEEHEGSGVIAAGMNALDGDDGRLHNGGGDSEDDEDGPRLGRFVRPRGTHKAWDDASSSSSSIFFGPTQRDEGDEERERKLNISANLSSSSSSSLSSLTSSSSSEAGAFILPPLGVQSGKLL